MYKESEMESWMKAGGYTKNNSILYMGKLMNELGDGAVKLSLCTSI